MKKRDCFPLIVIIIAVLIAIGFTILEINCYKKIGLPWYYYFIR